MAVESDQVWNEVKTYQLQFLRKNNVKSLQFEFSEFWGGASQTVARNHKKIWDVEKDWKRVATPYFDQRGTYTVTHQQSFPKNDRSVQEDGNIRVEADAVVPILDIKLKVRRLIKGQRGKTSVHGWKKK